MLLDKTVAIARLTPTSGNANKEQYQAVGNYQAVKMNIQPASEELTAVSNGVFGETFSAYVTVSGIRIGDQVTISRTSSKFIVKGVSDWNFGFIPHVELVLFQGDN